MWCSVGRTVHSFTLNSTSEWSVWAQWREVGPRALLCSLLAPRMGLVFPSKLGQLGFITMKPLLLSYPGIALSLTPKVNDFTFELCFPMDEGFSCTSSLTSLHDRWSRYHYSKCAVVDPNTQRGEKNCPGDKKRECLSWLVSEPRCSDWPGLWGPGWIMTDGGSLKRDRCWSGALRAASPGNPSCTSVSRQGPQQASLLSLSVLCTKEPIATGRRDWRWEVGQRGWRNKVPLGYTTWVTHSTLVNQVLPCGRKFTIIQLLYVIYTV